MEALVEVSKDPGGACEEAASLFYFGTPIFAAKRHRPAELQPPARLPLPRGEILGRAQQVGAESSPRRVGVRDPTPA
ncbi:MAG: hypothetical protein R3F11_14340 [Verrucomicrobiales bacterium]